MPAKNTPPKEKSDTLRRHSPCKTPHGARVALQHCTILRMGKSNLSVTYTIHHVNVQFDRCKCSVSPTQVFSLADSECSTAPT